MNILDIQSPNFSSGRKGYRPEAIVIHIMEGTLSGTDSWFRNAQSKVSAHYGIGVNGDVHRYVQETDTAWHAGRVNAPKWALIKPASGRGMFVNPNYYTIGIEHEGDGDSEWTGAMYDASAELVAGISGRWSIPVDRSHIVGHREIYSLKTCPGSKVDMDKLVEMAKQKAVSTPSPGFVSVQGTVVTTTSLNLRRGSPARNSPAAAIIAKGIQLNYMGYTEKGEKVSGVSRWYKTAEGLWFWGGGVAPGTVGQTKTEGEKMPTDCSAIKRCVRQTTREMCFAGTDVSEDVIGRTKITDLHLGQAPQMPGVSPLAAFVVKVAGCTDVTISNLTEAKVKGNPDWTVDDLSLFICMETKIAKGEPLR